MTNDRDFRTASPSSLDAIGGESLVGSGFEEEIPDADLPRYAPATEDRER